MYENHFTKTLDEAEAEAAETVLKYGIGSKRCLCGLCVFVGCKNYRKYISKRWPGKP